MPPSSPEAGTPTSQVTPTERGQGLGHFSAGPMVEPNQRMFGAWGHLVGPQHGGGGEDGRDTGDWKAQEDLFAPPVTPMWYPHWTLTSAPVA